MRTSEAKMVWKEGFPTKSRSMRRLIWGKARWGWSVRSTGETERRQRGDCRQGDRSPPADAASEIWLPPYTWPTALWTCFRAPWFSACLGLLPHPTNLADLCASFQPRWDVSPPWKLLDTLQLAGEKAPPPWLSQHLEQTEQQTPIYVSASLTSRGVYESPVASTVLLCCVCVCACGLHVHIQQVVKIMCWAELLFELKY